ncbi:hypothetical protein RDI58_017036 [Solanum bulbocastanum]|uniref:Uncharacterized protein n=1 Tax=Solanum bulbocastanum TaxID=147425 RepID=A0AAN8Y8R8_SOLBU
MEELDCSFLMKRRDFSKRDTNNFMILDSCHDLILINVDEHIYLWNPDVAPKYLSFTILHGKINSLH